MTKSIQPLIRPEFMPLSILRAIWKSKHYAVAVWILGSVAAYFYISRMPSLFWSEALVLVDYQKIPQDYVSSTVRVDVRDRLAAMSRRILSNDRLKELIQEMNLFGFTRGRTVPDTTVDQMRANIKLNLDTGWTGGLTAFRIGYSDSKPRVVAEVSNRLASFFVEENLKNREVQAEGTAEFIDSQLAEAKKKLDGLEAMVSQYKVRHGGELPQQQNALVGTLGRLQAELQANTEAINRVRQDKTILDNSLSMAQTTIAAVEQAIRDNKPVPSLAAIGAEPAAPPMSPIDAELRKLEGQMENLRLRYSDQHPDVKRLSITIEKLQQLKAKEPPAPAPRPRQPSAVELAAGRTAPPVRESAELAQARERMETLKTQIGMADKELAARAADQDRIRQEMVRVQAKMDMMPFREQEMSSITRDYDISRQNYQSLLGKKLAADMATDLERRQKSERFTVIDPARIPLKPFKPNRKMLMLLGSAVAMLLGLAVAFGNEFRRNVLLGEWELPPNAVVLGALPQIRIGAGTGALAALGRMKMRLAVWSSAISVAAVAGYFIAQRF